MKVVILCGGKGTRLREETEFRPKPMVAIGDRPILWHIMKTYAAHGHTDFILCLGYKGEVIKEFFRNYLWLTSDVTLALRAGGPTTFHQQHGEENWTVTLADTGENTLTAGRLKRIEKYLGADEHFLFTYGDGVGNVDIAGSIAFHRKHGRLLTLTAVHPPGRFGELGLDADGGVSEFAEKRAASAGWINGGFFVASRALLARLENTDQVMFEEAPIRELAADRQLMAWQHEGFWQPMDTFHEFTLLNRLWAENRAPWKVW